MNKAYFYNDKNYDGQVVGVQGTKRLELREVNELIFLVVLSDLGYEVLSREFVQDDLADPAPTIALYDDFTPQDVAQLATEADLNAVNLEGKWNLADPAGADAISTIISDTATNSYFGHIAGSDAAALSSVALLGGFLPLLAMPVRQTIQPATVANVGSRFLQAIGL